MSTGNQLATRLREVIQNGTWIANTNYKHELQNSSYELANVQVGNLNSIAALAQHMHYYMFGVLQVFRGGKLEISDKFSFDFPPITSQKQWDEFLTRFWNDTEEIASLIEAMTDEELNTVFIDEKYGTTHRNIEGLIEHSYYHLGQVVLIKKLVEKTS